MIIEVTLLYNLTTRMTRRQKGWVILGIDLVGVCLTFLTAKMLFGPAPGLEGAMRDSLPYLAVMIPIAALMSVYYGLHRVKLNAYELRGAVETAGLAFVVGVSGLILDVILGGALGGAVFFAFATTFLVFSVAARLLLRQFVLAIYARGQTRKKVLIYGAGQTGQQLATALLTDDALEPAAFVDDNPTLQSLAIAGLKVHSPVKIKEIIAKQGIERVILAMPSASHPVKAKLVRNLSDIGVEVHAVPSFAEIAGNRDLRKSAVPFETAALLGRNRLEDELPSAHAAYAGKRILVTGAGGSIGSELCRQFVACEPETLILLDHSELLLYQIERELKEMAPNLHIVPVLGSIIEKPLVERVFADHLPDVVFHAAAYKHLPLVEENCVEGLRNNVVGTKILCDAARGYEAERFVLVSSDKAVRPTSVMGSSKRLAELVVQDMAERSTSTRFSMVRFGNVLGSSGSVVPLFEDQIARGGPVTVTHADVTRFFMTISEAVHLVLLAGSFARGGDVFVLDMGQPVSIRQIARQMIEGAGLTVCDEDNPRGDIEIVMTGLRQGEKLHEELLIGSDMLTTPHPKIMRAQESKLSEIEVANMLLDLRKAIEAQDEGAARAVARRWVETRLEVGEQIT